MGEGGDTRWRVLGSLIFSEGVLALPLEPCAGITFRQIVVEISNGPPLPLSCHDDRF